MNQSILFYLEEREGTCMINITPYDELPPKSILVSTVLYYSSTVVGHRTYVQGVLITIPGTYRVPTLHLLVTASIP